jgi:hypothetical protein
MNALTVTSDGVTRSYAVPFTTETAVVADIVGNPVTQSDERCFPTQTL